MPIKKQVAGISCGLVTGDTDDDYIVLTDIQGLEDFFGDIVHSRNNINRRCKWADLVNFTSVRALMVF